MPKRNVGVLPMDRKYSINNIEYNDGNLGTLGICQNCGRIIQNIAHITDTLGNNYFVGLDCAETLQSSEIDNYWEFTKQKKDFNTFKGYISKINKIKKDGLKYTIDKLDYRYEITYKAKPAEFTSPIIQKDGTVMLRSDGTVFTTCLSTGLSTIYTDHCGQYNKQLQSIIDKQL